MKQALSRRHPLRTSAVVGACTFSVGALLTGACSAPQRFESAMTDQHADATEEETSEPDASKPGEPQPGETPDTSAVATVTPGDSSQSEEQAEQNSTNGDATSSSEDGQFSNDGDSNSPATSTAEDETSSAATTTGAPPIDPSSEAITSEPESTSGETVPYGSSGSPPSSTSESSTADSSGAAATTSEPNEPEPPDECPDDEQRVAGPCGCGHEPDPKCKALSDALIHRYAIVSHAEEGEYPASIPDSVGSADASVHDSRFDWDGSLLLDGNEGYLQFPTGLLSSREEVTLDLWVKWWGGSDNQRLLNFGHAPDSDDAPDNFLSISPSGGNGVLTVQYRTNPDERGDKLEAEYSLPTSDMHHLTLVIRAESFELYVNGESVGNVETAHHLHDLDDTDNWLGRALYNDYPLYNGALYEFRVFERALNDEEVTKMDEVGLDLP